MAARGNQSKKELASRLKEALDRVPGKQGEIASDLGISESAFSNYLNGSRSIPAEYLADFAKLTGVNPSFLLGVSDDTQQGYSDNAFSHALTFLRNCNDLGAYNVLGDRLTALDHLVPRAKKLHSGKVCITGSSLKGLQADITHEFVRVLTSYKREKPQVELYAILTHPVFAFAREKLETRHKGGIVTEVFQGLRWAMEQLHLEPENIKLMKASPCCFSVFVAEEHRGIALINPYPAMRQSYNCFSLIAHTVAPTVGGPSSTGSRSQAIYTTMYTANFQHPWDDESGKVTVDIDQMVKECMYSQTKIQNELGIHLTEDDVKKLNSDAQMLNDWLKDLEKTSTTNKKVKKK